MAAKEDVSTTRRTFAACAARSTRKVPSLAGAITSISSSGSRIGNGDATCSTNSHPAAASAQPASPVRSAAANDRCSKRFAPARASTSRTAGSFPSERLTTRAP
ncbi:hypothetical protein DIPPA_25692 [Diplonema papillatum]|nr:hypothetical protein DIPPA_25692 [Diplonema papillatum]